MLASFLIGLVGGQRALTPLATVAVAAARGALPRNTGAPTFLSNPLVAAATVALAAAEMGGDKMKSAPNRTALSGLIARFFTSAIAGAALAPRRHRGRGAIIGGVSALLASYPGWRARMAVTPRYGQTRTGLVEDALVLLAALAITHGRRRTA